MQTSEQFHTVNEAIATCTWDNGLTFSKWFCFPQGDNNSPKEMMLPGWESQALWQAIWEGIRGWGEERGLHIILHLALCKWDPTIPV